jgi:hypothetical protein
MWKMEEKNMEKKNECGRKSFGMISTRTPLPLFLFYTRVYHFITSNDIRDIGIMQFYKDSDLPTWRKSYMYNSNSRVSVEKTTWKPDVTWYDHSHRQRNCPMMADCSSDFYSVLGLL